jgi:hypothetical protein
MEPQHHLAGLKYLPEWPNDHDIDIDCSINQTESWCKLKDMLIRALTIPGFTIIAERHFKSQIKIEWFLPEIEFPRFTAWVNMYMPMEEIILWRRVAVDKLIGEFNGDMDELDEAARIWLKECEM